MIDAEAARALLEMLAKREDRAAVDYQTAAIVNPMARVEGLTFAQHGDVALAQATLLRSLASSLSGIAELKRDAERMGFLRATSQIQIKYRGEKGGAITIYTTGDSLNEDLDAKIAGEDPPARLASDSSTKRTP